MFTKESLESLRQKVDLTDLLSAHLELKRTGAAYKALCPFHDEKTASFTIQKGDTHYHCFGCGAHGDAIQFLMTHIKMSFKEAVESLAERFHVQLVRTQEKEDKGPNKSLLKDALSHASRFYHFYLLHTQEGRAALDYLRSRGIGLPFIQKYQIGLAPSANGVLRKILHGKFIADEIMREAGLLSASSTHHGLHDFFSERIMFPIQDAMGHVIGFSGRKYKEQTFGGKYINTPETALFKKSRVLFGLNYSRRQIAKERHAIIVEGQIDALQLIDQGFAKTVAGQGTAFGEGHVKELLQLGIQQVFLAFDPDNAGEKAACKVGDLFLREGVEVKVVQLPAGHDPDSFLKKHGPTQFGELMEKSLDYLSYLVRHHSKGGNADSPARKNELVLEIAKQIRSWNHEVLVHESLKRLALLTQVPEEMVGIGQHTTNVYLRKPQSVGVEAINPNRILECDFLRWLLLLGQGELLTLAREKIQVDTLHDDLCKRVYERLMETAGNGQPWDILTLTIEFGEGFITELLEKKINREKAKESFIETMQRILERNWMEAREAIKRKIHNGQCTDDEALELSKQFDHLKRHPPKI